MIGITSIQIQRNTLSQLKTQLNLLTKQKSLINQRQVHRDTLDFSAALRSALREDPDVILVGEMRDLETIRLALTAAETGHLVMGTLHTSSAPRSISHVISMFSWSEKHYAIFVRIVASRCCQTLC